MDIPLVSGKFPVLTDKQKEHLEIMNNVKELPLHDIIGLKYYQDKDFYSFVYDKVEMLDRRKAKWLAYELELKFLENYKWTPTDPAHMNLEELENAAKILSAMGFVPIDPVFYCNGSKAYIGTFQGAMDFHEALRFLYWLRNLSFSEETEKRSTSLDSLIRLYECFKGKLVGILGAGMQSVVFKIKYGGHDAALKVVYKKEAQCSLIASHYGFGPKLYDYIPCLEKKAVIIMELAEGTLSDIRDDILAKGKEQETIGKVLMLLAQAALCGIDHRDTKLNNIFVSGDRYMLGDYGMSELIESPSSEAVYYMINFNFHFFMKGFRDPGQQNLPGKSFKFQEFEHLYEYYDKVLKCFSSILSVITKENQIINEKPKLAFPEIPIEYQQIYLYRNGNIIANFQLDPTVFRNWSFDDALENLQSQGVDYKQKYVGGEHFHVEWEYYSNPDGHPYFVGWELNYQKRDVTYNEKFDIDGNKMSCCITLDYYSTTIKFVYGIIGGKIAARIDGELDVDATNLLKKIIKSQ